MSGCKHGTYALIDAWGEESVGGCVRCESLAEKRREWAEEDRRDRADEDMSGIRDGEDRW